MTRVLLLFISWLFTSPARQLRMIGGLCATLLLCACGATPSSPEPSPYARGKLQISQLTQHYPEVIDQPLSDYLHGLQRTLLFVAPKAVANRARALEERRKLHVLLGTPQPLAECAAHGTTVLSLGLLGKIASRDELAFVLAHELSHYLLGHTEVQAAPSSQLRERHELEADHFALALTGLAGFRGFSGPEAVIRLSKAENSQSLNGSDKSSKQSSHPELSNRLQQMYGSLPLLNPRYRYNPADKGFIQLQARAAMLLR